MDWEMLGGGIMMIFPQVKVKDGKDDVDLNVRKGNLLQTI